jgi:hypothetical protein
MKGPSLDLILCMNKTKATVLGPYSICPFFYLFSFLVSLWVPSTCKIRWRFGASSKQRHLLPPSASVHLLYAAMKNLQNYTFLE